MTDNRSAEELARAELLEATAEADAAALTFDAARAAYVEAVNRLEHAVIAVDRAGDYP